MTNEEAYKWLYVHFAPCGDETKQDEAISIALEAIAKQIPKKPGYTKLKYKCNGKDIEINHPECPYCRTHGLSLWDASIPIYDKYCNRCGQTIDWGEIIMIEIKENELYQEIELFDGNQKIGEAEVDIKGKMLSRLVIYEPYQNKGYGTEIVKNLKDRYGCDCLWVTADNDRAIHVYEKCGFKKVKPTMYLMELNEGE